MEQDNNTEKISTIEGKVQNYYNVYLHNEFPVNGTIKYYIFRFDMYLNLNQTWTCNQSALKSEEYKIYMSEISKLDKLRLMVSKCNDEFELIKLIQDNGINVGDFIMTSSTLTKNKNRLIKLLSSKKSEFRLNIDNLKRAKKKKLIPFLEKLEENLPEKYENIIADAGYESEENYVYIEEHQQNAYIKPQVYEQWKKRSFKNLIGKRENMSYDESLDEYTCNQGRKLKKVGTAKRKSFLYPKNKNSLKLSCKSRKFQTIFYFLKIVGLSQNFTFEIAPLLSFILI